MFYFSFILHVRASEIKLFISVLFHVVRASLCFPILTARVLCFMHHASVWLFIIWRCAHEYTNTILCHWNIHSSQRYLQNCRRFSHIDMLLADDLSGDLSFTQKQKLCFISDVVCVTFTSQMSTTKWNKNWTSYISSEFSSLSVCRAILER